MKHLLPLLALGILPVSAQSISTDDAHQLARQFFTTHAASGAHHALAKVEPVLAYTATTASTPDFYVFNRAEDIPGFVIVNADATSDTQILGYCESSTFDYETAPDNFKWWLEQYQINGVAKTAAKAPGMRHDVDYLCKTKWNQDSPYWNSIPYYGETPYVTGCAATSMAQVMKYFNYPDQGVGSHSYTSETLGHTYSANFAGTTYDWANMLEDYSHGYNATQANAVATLMYHCGVAQDMNYNVASVGGSGAYPGDNAKAMIEYFKYDKSMLVANHSFYTDEAWEEMIYNEIINGRPILYSGKSTGGGHSFICDGYRSLDKTYHFNWGWGGYCDGYYALTGDNAIAPNGSGIGGSSTSDGYTSQQYVLFNIKPDEGGEYPIQAALYNHFIVGTNPAVTTTFTSKSIDRSSSNADIPVYFRLRSYNYGLSTIKIKSGVLLRHTTTETTYGQIGFDILLELAPSKTIEYSYDGLEYAHFNTSIAPYNGTYEIIPAYTTDNGVTWHPMAMLAGDSYPTITITGGEDAQPVELPFTISSSEVEVGKNITIAPHNDFHGNVVYTSSNPTVASVSAAGVITGVKEGHATITATSEETSAFLATTKTFDIDVVAHIMHNVDVTLDKHNLLVDETANISITKDYDGEVTYTVVPEGVVSISADGIVTALAEGDATITVNVAGNYDFRPAKRQFDITVSNVPPAPIVPGFCMDNYPYVGENNIATSSDLTVHIPLYNNSESEIDPANFYVRMFCDGGYVTWTCGFYSPYASHSQYEYKINPIEYGYDQYFTPGKVYTYEFYLDANCTKPMNVPSLTYYYCPDNPTVTTVAHLIDGAKKGNGATPKLIKSLSSKILMK